MEMSPCVRTDKRTSEYRATQSMDNVRLTFAIKDYARNFKNASVAL